MKLMKTTGCLKKLFPLCFCQFSAAFRSRNGIFLKVYSMGCSKISKILILGAKFAKKFTILYKQRKTFFNEKVHLKSVSKHDGQVKESHRGE